MKKESELSKFKLSYEYDITWKEAKISFKKVLKLYDRFFKRRSKS